MSQNDTAPTQNHGIPSFARDFPSDANLQALVVAFAQGDYATVRKGARALASASEDAEVKQAALTLIERTKADPLARALLALGGILLLIVSAWWIANGHPPH